ncbi:MAG: hypothetical protein JST35_01315 [Armatimonadetes bacterium]|nr:hypothetical protein [Armatimonadota bacterium]
MQIVRDSILALVAGAVGAGLTFGALVATGQFNGARLDVQTSEGKKGFVAASVGQMPGVIRNGKEFNPASRKGAAGVLFYNNNGDEAGGIISQLNKGSDGLPVGGISLSLDQVDHDGQAISLMNYVQGGFARSALRINDYPADIDPKVIDDDPERIAAWKAVVAAKEEDQAKEFRKYQEFMGKKRYFSERIYLGTAGGKTRSAYLELKDSKSQPRLRLTVDENDEPRIEFLDAKGKVKKVIK